MKLVLVLIMALLLPVCDQPTANSKDASVGPTASASNSETQGDAGFEVKVTLDGAEFAAYRVSGPRKLVMNDGGVLPMFLSSNDNKNILTLHIQGINTGI